MLKLKVRRYFYKERECNIFIKKENARNNGVTDRKRETTLAQLKKGEVLAYEKKEAFCILGGLLILYIENKRPMESPSTLYIYSTRKPFEHISSGPISFMTVVIPEVVSP